MTKPPVMPDSNDIKQMNDKIYQLQKIYHNNLVHNVTVHNYEKLCEVTIASMIILNRRRSGEVAHAELSFYLDRNNNETSLSDDIANQLSKEEQTLIKNLQVMIIPGKIVRAVPIILTNSIAKDVDLIISCRKELSIPDTNNLLFARPGTNNPFVGSTIIRTIRQSLQLKRPQDMTAVGLRHHCATMSHVLGENIKTEDLTEFMGHTSEVHKRKYRYPLEVIQKSKIAPHLFALSGSSLTNVETPSETCTNFMDKDMPTESQGQLNSENKSMSLDLDIENFPNLEHERSENNIAKKKQKKRWTDEEKTIVIKHFQSLIKKGINPGTKRCQELLEIEPQILHNRSWQQINLLVDNYNKGKIALPVEFLYLRDA